MPFQKGNKLGKGRPKLTDLEKELNQHKDWTRAGNELLRLGAQSLMAELKKYHSANNHKEVLKLLDKYLEFFMPKQARVEAETTHTIDINVKVPQLPAKEQNQIIDITAKVLKDEKTDKHKATK